MTTTAGRILRGHARDDGNWDLRRGRWLAYTVKGVICAVFGWWAKGNACFDPKTFEGCDTVDLAMYGFHETESMEWGHGGEWTAVKVAHGWRRGTWHLHESEDGYP